MIMGFVEHAQQCSLFWCNWVVSEGTLIWKRGMENLKARLKVLKDSVQAAVDEAMEKLHDQLRSPQRDTEALNKKLLRR